MARLSPWWLLWVLAVSSWLASAAEGEEPIHEVRPCSVPHPTNENYILEGADFQYKVRGFYLGTGPPPLEEAFFITQNLTRETQEVILKECPGLLLTAFIMLAEVRHPVAPGEAAMAMVKADTLASRLAAEEFATAQQDWPIAYAVASFRNAEAITVAGANAVKKSGPTQLHFVVCHCRESLQWLTDGRIHMPQNKDVEAELFLYEKCKVDSDPATFTPFFTRAQVIHVVDGDVRRDECSGFLQHLVDNYHHVANFTFFFQADAGDHMQWGYLNLVLKAIQHHSLQVPFVHLNHPRLVASLSPCRAEVFREVFGRKPKKMLGSYCCAQFLVSRERVQKNPLELYQKMQRMLFSDSPSECHDIPGHSTLCLMYEVYWHVLFGEEDDLPERADNNALPLFLRIRDLENESYLPPGSMFLASALFELEE